MIEFKEFNKLKSIAERATPGSWVVYRPWLSRGIMDAYGVIPRANLHPEESYQVKTEHNHGSCSYSLEIAVPSGNSPAKDGSQAAANMEFIATFNPEVVTTLLDEHDRMRRALNFIVNDASSWGLEAEEYVQRARAALEEKK